WLLHRVGREERRVVATLAHGQGDKAFFGQFLFTTIGDQHFGRNLGFQLTKRFKGVYRQVFYRTAALRTDDVRAPAVFGEAVGQTGGQQVGRFASPVVFVIAGHVYFVVEASHRHSWRVISYTP